MEEFGGTVNSKGYKLLDPHVKAIMVIQLQYKDVKKFTKFSWKTDSHVQMWR